jgi:hypothetical protein
MRIKMLQKPTIATIDGLRLDTFQPGFYYEVGPTLAALLLAEGWAEPATETPALPLPLEERITDAPARPPRPSHAAPPNLHRETHPPSLDIAMTDDALPRPRGRKTARNRSKS